MCTEPQSMAAIIATQAQQVVLIGDHQQLRPSLTCIEAAHVGLNQLLFYRLQQHSPNLSVFLQKQYRMHPAICSFPSNQFYEGSLETRPAGRRSASQTWNVEPLPFWPRRALQPWPQDNANGAHVLAGMSEYDRQLHLAYQAIPHLLVDVRGHEAMLTTSTEEGNNRSRSNTQEVDKVMEILDFLKKQSVSLRRVAVLTQYKAQQVELENRMRRTYQTSANSLHYVDWAGLPFIGTVVASQGSEWDYVILSTVRSLASHQIEGRPTRGWCYTKLGFITDYHQVNVALTRARRGLFIVGNVELLRCDEVWAELVQSYDSQGCVVKARDFPPK